LELELVSAAEALAGLVDELANLLLGLADVAGTVTYRRILVREEIYLD
jgi:hypothetical protein